MNYEIKDSSESLLIEECINSAKNNFITLHNTSPKYRFDGAIIDAPRNVVRRFDELVFGNLVEVNVPQRMKYSPEKLAKSYYGTTDLWWLVLYSARMRSHSDMCNDKIQIADKAIIPDIQNIIKGSSEELNEVADMEDLTLYNLKM